MSLEQTNREIYEKSVNDKLNKIYNLLVKVSQDVAVNKKAIEHLVLNTADKRKVQEIERNIKRIDTAMSKVERNTKSVDIRLSKLI